MNTDQQNDLALIRRALFSGQKSIAKSQAQAAFLRLVQQLPSVPRGLGEISQQDINEIQDLLENIPTNLEEDRRNSRVIEALKRARVVGVLDAWTPPNQEAPTPMRTADGERWVMRFDGFDCGLHKSADDARYAAVQTIETKRIP